MNDRLVDRKIEAYMALGPTVLADRVLDAAFDEVHLTRQRHVVLHVPWRFPVMNTYAKVALAAVVVIAIGAVGLALFRPAGSSGVGGPPAVSPATSLSPATSPGLVGSEAPALTGQYTSATHGISMAYPDGWLTKPATIPWTSGLLDFGSEAGDVLYDASIPAHLWLAFGSQPLAGRTADQWTNEILSLYGCTSDEPFTIDGEAGTICTEGLGATVTAGDRGYVIVGYTSGDEPWLEDAYDRDWFERVLATVQLRPEDAVDPAPTTSP